MITNLLAWITISVMTNTTGGTYPIGEGERIQSNIVEQVVNYTFLDPRDGHQHQVSVSETNVLSSVTSREKLMQHWMPVPINPTNVLDNLIHHMPPMPPINLSNNVPVQGSPPSPRVSRTVEPAFNISGTNRVVTGRTFLWAPDGTLKRVETNYAYSPYPLPRSAYVLPGTPANLERARRTTQ